MFYENLDAANTSLEEAVVPGPVGPKRLGPFRRLNLELGSTYVGEHVRLGEKVLIQAIQVGCACVLYDIGKNISHTHMYISATSCVDTCTSVHMRVLSCVHACNVPCVRVCTAVCVLYTHHHTHCTQQITETDDTGS